MILDANAFMVAIGSVLLGMLGVGVVGFALNKRQPR